ncbi:hypothetical protein LINPERPRIM_LOCUS19933 [Linum perenne]
MVSPEQGTEIGHEADRNEEESEVAAANVINEVKGMTPWEQHAGIISIPRYDYKAPSSLLQYSHSGFLLTCSIKREKSATKEAMFIFQKYIGSSNCGNIGDDRVPDVTNKRRKVCQDGDSTVEVDTRVNVEEKHLNPLVAGEVSEDTVSAVSKNETVEEGKALNLSLVKLIKSGLLLFTFPREASSNTVDTVSKIFRDVESGSLKPPTWCHRIFPIEATCCLNEKDLHATVRKLVRDYVHDKQIKPLQPLKFAVAYTRRGMEEQKIFAREDMKESEVVSLLNRDKCFRVVASAVKETVPDSTIDLKSPDMSILVELLPLSGVADGSLVAAVSAVPESLTSTKPRLCIKALSSDAKVKKGKS